MEEKIGIIMGIVVGILITYLFMYIGYPQLIFIAGIAVGIASKKLIHASIISIISPLITLIIVLVYLQSSNPYGFSQALSALSQYLALYTVYICISSLLGGLLGYWIKSLHL